MAGADWKLALTVGRGWGRGTADSCRSARRRRRRRRRGRDLTVTDDCSTPAGPGAITRPARGAVSYIACHRTERRGEETLQTVPRCARRCLAVGRSVGRAGSRADGDVRSPTEQAARPRRLRRTKRASIRIYFELLNAAAIHLTIYAEQVYIGPV